MLEGIHWLGHASFCVEHEGFLVYIDPWKLTHPAPADLVLVTHSHHDHFSPDDIARLHKDGTVIVAPAAVAAQLHGQARVATAGEALTVGPARVQVVPAYNTNKPNHPRSAGFVGYVLELGGRRIYHAGDTDLIPEMSDIRCDVALLPIGGTYTMNAAEAAQAVERLGAKVAVGMHWGDVVGSEKDLSTFQAAVGAGAQVVALRPE